MEMNIQCGIVFIDPRGDDCQGWDHFHQVNRSVYLLQDLWRSSGTSVNEGIVISNPKRIAAMGGIIISHQPLIVYFRRDSSNFKSTSGRLQHKEEAIEYGTDPTRTAAMGGIIPPSTIVGYIREETAGISNRLHDVPRTWRRPSSGRPAPQDDSSHGWYHITILQ